VCVCVCVLYGDYSELGASDLRRRVLVTLWQTAESDPRLDRLIGASSFGVLNVACNKTVSQTTPSWLRLLVTVAVSTGAAI